MVWARCNSFAVHRGLDRFLISHLVHERVAVPGSGVSRESAVPGGTVASLGGIHAVGRELQRTPRAGGGLAGNACLGVRSASLRTSSSLHIMVGYFRDFHAQLVVQDGAAGI